MLPPCCHTTYLYPPTMVGVSSSSVLSLSTLSMCNGGVGCVSSLSSPKLACLCEKRLMLFESLKHGIIRMCPYELFESTNDLVSVVCVENAFVVEKGSAIGTSLIQHSLLECISPVFCFIQCTCPQSHSLQSPMCLTNGQLTPPFTCGLPMWCYPPWGVVCCCQHHSTRTLSHSSPTHTVHVMVLVVLRVHRPQ